MIPRWTVYPSLVLLTSAPFLAVPKPLGDDPHAGVAAATHARGVAAPVPERAADPGSSVRTSFDQVVVLGIDGMDPEILAEVMEKHPDRMPNFRWLIESGTGIHSLGTSIPPQSPVAWSNFITGQDPGGHGIFDFIHRDKETYGVLGSTTRETQSWLYPLFGEGVPLPGKWQLPAMGLDSESNRDGDSFWQVLRENGVPADIWRMPANFPVEASNGLSFPGMMTPALDSAYGECSFFTTDDSNRLTLQSRYEKVFKLTNVEGRIDSVIWGPDNPAIDPDAFGVDDEDIEDNERARRATVAKNTLRSEIPFTIYVDEEANAAAIVVDDGEPIVLEPGQWSDFVEVSYKMLPMGAMNLNGILRFYLRSISPEVELYVSPVNLSPMAPPTPVSEPLTASAELAEEIGPYYTQGMAEDVNALKNGVLTDAEFMQQVELVYTERRRMMDYALDRYEEDDEGGLLFFYYSTVDLACHMMWRHTDPVHPAHDHEVASQDSSWWSGRDGTTWKDVVTDLYLRMDPVLGRLRERLGDDVTYIVMSDHGFAPYRRKFDLNRWLVDNGYLVLTAETQQAFDEAGDAGHSAYIGVGPDGESAVDWSKTRAYAMGFNGLYLNLKGREGQGIVDPTEKDALVAKLKRELEAIVDPLHPDAKPVYRADITSQVYSGKRVDEAPDIQVGYNVGYGNSDPASTGFIGSVLFEDNTGGTFNGSHLMAPDVVAGILISNRPVLEGDHALEDLTVELLRRYGVDPTAEMKGSRVLAD